MIIVKRQGDLFEHLTKVFTAGKHNTELRLRVMELALAGNQNAQVVVKCWQGYDRHMHELAKTLEDL